MVEQKVTQTSQFVCPEMTESREERNTESLRRPQLTQADFSNRVIALSLVMTF